LISHHIQVNDRQPRVADEDAEAAMMVGGGEVDRVDLGDERGVAAVGDVDGGKDTANSSGTGAGTGAGAGEERDVDADVNQETPGSSQGSGSGSGSGKDSTTSSWIEVTTPSTDNPSPNPNPDSIENTNLDTIKANRKESIDKNSGL
jgi:hypothetical protein